MFKIVVITHEYHSSKIEKYLIFDVLQELERRGHTISITRGVARKRTNGDAAILHVDATCVPQEYLEYARSFRVCLNSNVTDISKRRISGALLTKGDGWNARVIVKSNLNCAGKPESRSNQRAKLKGVQPPFPDTRVLENYTVYQTLSDVPHATFDDPDLVVEKFIPERDHQGFAARFWVFCGDRERCNRYVCPEELVKASTAVRREPAPVPDDLRLRRAELGFDFGKFDFVIHEGRAVLLDANRTPSRPPNLSSSQQREISSLADGFERLISGRMGEAPSRTPGRLGRWIFPELHWRRFRAR